MQSFHFRSPFLSRSRDRKLFDATEARRSIAYNMDLLLPGFYLWVGGLTIRLGGSIPDDEPYRYPGTVHSFAGVAVVLPNYRIFTTYTGTYDPGQTST